MHLVKFKDMRLQVIGALEALSDVEHQRHRWGKVEEGVRFYDDLTLNIHILYDDCQVLPDPSSAIGDILFEAEVAPLLGLDEHLASLLDDLGDEPDGAYTADPRWPAVVEASGVALRAMQRSERA